MTLSPIAMVVGQKESWGWRCPTDVGCGGASRSTYKTKGKARARAAAHVKDLHGGDNRRW